MIYDPEIVRKNMKFMRKLYVVTQEDLAEVLKITQHGVSQYETGSRSLSYESVQMLANYFRIPIEQFVKEDLSETIVLNPSIDMNYIFELFEIMFPIFKSSKALEDEYFKRGYDNLLSIIEDSKRDKCVSMKKLEDCIDLFIQSYNNFQTIESVANVLGFILLIYEPAFDKEKRAFGENVYKKKTIDKEVFRKHFLRTTITNDLTKEKFVEDNSDFILECIQVLKKFPKWSELGDYYLALRYTVGVVDNEHKEDMNILIGEELMGTLFELENKYATAYLNKKYSFLTEKE